MDLIKLLPNYYDKNVTMQTLQSVISQASSKLEDRLSNTIQECFAATASGLLSRYEQFLGLEVDISKSDTFRRERIFAKISGEGTATKAMLMDVASRYSNGEVELIEDNANSSFTIKFVGSRGIPGNMRDLKMTVEEIKPAHLAVTYEYVYNTWDEVSSLTWQQAGEYTWKGVRTAKL